MIRTVLESPFWDMLTFVAVAVGLVAALLFVIRYQYEVGFSWWRLANGKPNHFGRFLMIRKLLLSALFSLVLINGLTERDWLGREPVTALLMVAFALQTFVPYRLLVTAQKAHESQEVENDGNELRPQL